MKMIPEQINIVKGRKQYLDEGKKTSVYNMTNWFELKGAATRQWIFSSLNSISLHELHTLYWIKFQFGVSQEIKITLNIELGIL